MHRKITGGLLLVPLLLGALLSLGLTGRAAAVSKPGAPSLSLPGVTVPSVTVPSVTVPSVTVPGTTITTPPVSTPSVGTPSVTAPRVSSPGTLTPTFPGASSSGASGSSAPGQSPGASASTASGAGTAAGAPGAGSGGASATAARAHAVRTGAAASRSSRQARETRLLRALVTRDRGCLAGLSAGQQHLLSLRAGLDGQSGRSPEAVARIIHVSGVREARIERGALSALRAQAGHGCPGDTVASSFTAFTGTQRAAMVAWLGAGSTPASTASSSGSVAHHSSPGISQSGGVTRAAGKKKARSGRGGSFGPSNERASIAGAPVGGSSSLLPILVGVLAVLAAGLLVIPLQRRRVAGAAAGSTGTVAGSTGVVAGSTGATSGASSAGSPSSAAPGPAASSSTATPAVSPEPASAAAPAAAAGALAGAGAAAAHRENEEAAGRDSSSTSGSESSRPAASPGPTPASARPTPETRAATPPPSSPSPKVSHELLPAARAGGSRSLARSVAQSRPRVALVATAAAGMIVRVVTWAISRRRRGPGG